jgi:hypothetical protein
MAASCNARGRADNAGAMTDQKSGKGRKAESRSQRLAAELRENLRRRKAQERGRKAPATDEGTKRPGFPPRDGQIR